MIELNVFYNEDCQSLMKRMDDNSVDVVLTSPPYNMTKRKGGYADKEKRYDLYQDWKSPEEYCQWTSNIFNQLDRVLKPNGVILYNFSYGIENPSLPYQMISHILTHTDFMVADTVVWKKPSAIPHPASYNRLNRIVEFIYVFVRKSEIKTFNCYKPVVKVSPKGQKYYEVIDNYVEAKNNDGSTNFNKATYSSELCDKLLYVYSTEGKVVFDPFMGTGTTAVSCVKNNMNFIGAEISKEQVKYSISRLVDVG